MENEYKEKKGSGEQNKYDSLKFALAIFIALGTLSYKLYSYLQNTAVSEDVYSIFCDIFTIFIISGLYLFIYLFIKGYSLEIDSSYNPTFGS